MEGDAQELPWAKARHPVEPKRTAVWIRLGGAWRRGWVRHWDRAGPDWMAWITYQGENPGTHVGLFLYDPETIVPKEGDNPPE